MLDVTKEIIYQPFIELILKYYLEKMTHTYPQGCQVSLQLNDQNQIIAEIIPDLSAVPSITEMTILHH